MGPDYNIGDYVITLSVDEVIKKYGIHQGFNNDKIIARVIKKEFLHNHWMIQVKEVEGNRISNVWLNQYIFDPYLAILREEKLNKILK